MNYYREDIQPTTVMGQRMKLLVENGDHCDGNIYWLIEMVEAQRLVIEDSIPRFNELSETASNRFDEIRKLQKEIDRLKAELIHYLGELKMRYSRPDSKRFCENKINELKGGNENERK